MTKITILGEAQGAEPEKKKIEFIKACNVNQWGRALCRPSDYTNIEVIAIGFTKEFDLFFAYKDNRSKGSLYLGHFNDGVV